LRRKLFLIIASLMTLMLISGCNDYSDIEAQLREVEIENRLPDVDAGRFRTMADAEDAVYEQQIAACEMLSDSYDKTYYTNFIGNVKGSEKRIREICNQKRQSIEEDIEKLYKKNIYAIMEDVEDCPNVDAFVDKTYSNVCLFYDEYNSYQNADNEDVELTNILVYYHDRRNLLAKSFLARNEIDVFEASVAVIEGNAQADEEFRFYINKNNSVIKALNEIYGGVPEEYAYKIEIASNKLATNLINSLESLTDRERGQLMDELGLSTPTPSPRPTPTVKPSMTPSPTPRPTAVPTAKPTAKPTARPATKPSTQLTEGEEGTSVEEQNTAYILD